MKKITIIDGQGGKIGKTIIEQLKKIHPEQELYAIGTNALATSAMLKSAAARSTAFCICRSVILVSGVHVR